MNQISTGKLEAIARFGYGARGIIYLIIGGLAIQEAFGSGGDTTDSKGALLTILSQPFGQVLLGVVAAGLLGYAIWRFVQSVWDADGQGSDAKGLTVRAGLLVSCATHVSLAFFAVSIIFGWSTGSGGGGDNGTQGWTAALLSMPFGRWIVGFIGVIVIIVGIANIIKGWKAKFEKRLRMDEDKKTWISPVCRFGLAARGVVFMIIGGFFIVAAVQFSSGKAKGLEGALEALRQQPYGTWLLGIVALGLFAFGIYSMVEAVYRRIDDSAV